MLLFFRDKLSIYIFNLLKDTGIKIKTIPGVPSFLAIASHIERPLTYGNDILTIIPATADKKDIISALKFSNVSVLMKVYKNFEDIVDILQETDFENEAVLVSRCGLEDEKIITDIENHKSEQLNYLSTILTRKNIEEV